MPSIPPLSMGIAATRASMLEKEAWFYDHLQILQGSVVPRCYGLFEAPLEWNKTKSLVHPTTNTVWKSAPTLWWKEQNESYVKPNHIVILLLERLSSDHPPYMQLMPEADR